MADGRLSWHVLDQVTQHQSLPFVEPGRVTCHSHLLQVYRRGRCVPNPGFERPGTEPKPAANKASLVGKALVTLTTNNLLHW